MIPEAKAHAGAGAGERILRWSELPRLLQAILERTPRGQWYRIRPVLALSPETNRVLDLANLVEQVLPRSSLGLRRRGLSTDERSRKAQELIQSLDEFWAGVEGLEKVVEKIAKSCGLWSFFEPRKSPGRPVPSPKGATPREKPKAAMPPPPPKPDPAAQGLTEAVFELDAGAAESEPGEPT
jgi:hypothetical protein